nr:hypothetical protein OG409_37920 [Streptomyces sp. NBC_00974]
MSETITMPLTPMTPHAVMSAFNYLRAVEAGGTEAAAEFIAAEPRMPALLIEVAHHIVIPTTNLPDRDEKAVQCDSSFGPRRAGDRCGHAVPGKDPFGLVPSLMLIPLLVGGYMASTMLRTVTGSATGRRRLTAILAFSVLAGLLVNLVVGLWLRGYPLDKFWIVWPILSLVIAGVAAVAAVLQKLLGAAGTLVTVTVVTLFGNPSSGGANGVPYLPAFWTDIGPFLPPRNAYILLRNTIYFDGHGTTQALIVLLLYLAVPAIALALLDRFRTPEIPLNRETEAEATALTVPVGGLP